MNRRTVFVSNYDGMRIWMRLTLEIDLKTGEYYYLVESELDKNPEFEPLPIDEFSDIKYVCRAWTK